jgi:arrestin-2
VYLGKRDFLDDGDHTDSIDGVVVVDNDYLKGRKVYGQVTTMYRYGREEDEVMGLKFSKELVLAHQQIVPSEEKAKELTALQVQ